MLLLRFFALLGLRKSHFEDAGTPLSSIPNVSSVQPRNLVHQIKSQPNGPDVSLVMVLGAKEWFEDMRLIGWIDPRPLVSYAQNDVPCITI